MIVKTPKKIIKKPVVKKVAPLKVKTSRYFEAIGRRKTAIARVRIQDQGNTDFIINDKPAEKYFPIFELQQIIKESLTKTNELGFNISVKVRGGGLHSQAEAVRHGIARALVKFNALHRKILQKSGLLTRDSRMRERKKPGLKRARRAPQWKKR